MHVVYHCACCLSLCMLFIITHVVLTMRQVRIVDPYEGHISEESALFWVLDPVAAAAAAANTTQATPTTSPTAPSAPMVVVAAKLSLAVDYVTYSSSLVANNHDLASGVAAALGVSTELVTIVSVSAGSVVVNMLIATAATTSAAGSSSGSQVVV